MPEVVRRKRIGRREKGTFRKYHQSKPSSFQEKDEASSSTGNDQPAHGLLDATEQVSTCDNNSGYLVPSPRLNEPEVIPGAILIYSASRGRQPILAPIYTKSEIFAYRFQPHFSWQCL